MRIKIWGARGSLPAPYAPTELHKKVTQILMEFAHSKYNTANEVQNFLDEHSLPFTGGYGGNTPCVEVKTEKTQLIIDGGSGIRQLGYDLLAGPCGKGQGEVHILFTHFHWDHLIGLPFFVPLFIPSNEVHVYAVQDDLPNVFQTLFKKPFFPVPLENLGAKIHYHRLEPRKPQMMGDIQVTPYELDHPDPCWGFKMEHGGKTYAHCVDTECTRGTRDELGPDLPLYQGVDLMVFDAQYTLMETIEKIDWGHAAASLGIDMAMREGIKRVIFMHHDPASNDEKIAAAETEALRYYNAQQKIAKRAGQELHAVDWQFAVEGMEEEV